MKPVFIITMASVVMIVGLGIVLYMIPMSEDVSQNNMEHQDTFQGLDLLKTMYDYQIFI